MSIARRRSKTAGLVAITDRKLSVDRGRCWADRFFSTKRRKHHVKSNQNSASPSVKKVAWWRQVIEVKVARNSPLYSRRNPIFWPPAASKRAQVAICGRILATVDRPLSSHFDPQIRRPLDRIRDIVARQRLPAGHRSARLIRRGGTGTAPLPGGPAGCLTMALVQPP